MLKLREWTVTNFLAVAFVMAVVVIGFLVAFGLWPEEWSF